jgi:phosphatidylserine/phosphatidylglycerophosphate/cardiolipin synthase-like enzyme
MGNVTHLDPGSLVFNSSQGATIIDGGERRLVQFTSHTQLWDEHNHLFLRDASNVIVDTAFYTTDYGEDIALIRNTQSIDPWTPAPWKTPGQPEPGTTPSASTVRFSEILPDAIGADNQRWPDGEWIELHNYGSTDVDLTGWKLQAASRSLTLHESNMPLQSTPVLPAGEVVLIALNGTSSFYLKHTSADSIGLLDATGSTVDTITWSDTVEGESLIPPNSTHAGVGPNGSLTTGDWVLSAWATPGQLNPVWPAYTGSLSLAVTEVLPYCNDDSIIPNEDWVEVHNTGSTPLNISRWSVLNADGERRFMRLNDIWADTNQTAKVELLPDERAVFLMDAWMLTGLGDSFELLHPDGDIVTNVAWTAITDCQTLMPGITAGDDWQHTLWPTPGAPEPDASQFAGKDDLIFTRFMPSATTDASGDMEFIEITNLGQQLAVLNGWTLRSTTGSMSTYNASITSLMIQPQQSVLLANDADQLSSYEIGTVVDISDALDRTFYFPNSGAALQLLDPSGAQADTLVYGNGPVTLSGWSGIALVEPIAYLDNIIYLRGSGCGDAPDTNTVADWHLRWSRLGGSTFCYDRHIVSNGDITPLISPENGVVDLLSWIEDATTNLTVHLYQLQHAQLVHALIDAQQRGVEVSVFLDYGDDWWSQYELDTQRGMATTLLSNGVEVHWFGDEGENPYAYLHSKVAVRDGQSVWMGSGNWKSSSQPSPETPGNRDWGVIVDDASLAEMVLQHLAFDMDNGQSHISPVLLSEAPSGWSMPSKTPIVGQTATSIAGAFEAELLVCPDTCIDSLVTILNGAEEEILLSLQYLDMDWSYGWGDNPIVTALGDAAQRGVRIRLVLNGAYLDEDIQLVVDRFNEEWNFTNGYDTAAIVMSDNETVTKLHNKGAIIDGEHVLISSINWGDSALVRNREMGLLLSSPAVASVYEDAWWDDWNRVDSTTDSDQDRLLDAWEVMYGLNRTRRSVVGNALSDESMVDMDGDGLSNFAEQLHGGNPNKADTDGDCILDGVEVAWAQATALNDSMARVMPLDALTKADADGNGVLDAEELGCDLGGISLPNDNTTLQGNDEDADGVLNDSDLCPNTLPGAPTDEQGCSSAQRAALVQDSTENTSGNAAQSFFLIVMVFALLLSAGAYFVLQNMRSESQTVNEALGEVAFEEVMPTPVQPGWQKPVLDATQSSITADMLARVPGWDETMVETYLKQGWTMDQLATYYQEQMEQHVQSEQH